MKDWKSIAQAGGIEIPTADMERIVPPLDALEEAFRPLAKDLPPDLEPDVTFETGEEAQ